MKLLLSHCPFSLAASKGPGEPEQGAIDLTESVGVITMIEVVGGYEPVGSTE